MKNHCRSCGKEIKADPALRPTKYCSKQCFVDAQRHLPEVQHPIENPLLWRPAVKMERWA